MLSNHVRPPGFPPVPNNQNLNLQRNNQSRFIPNQNQNRGNNFQQGSVYQPPGFQTPASQAPAYQAPAPQTQGVSKEDFSVYVKANDAVLRNMQNQLTNITDLMTKFVNATTAFTSNSGTLPSNTIANPRSDLKAITTRSALLFFMIFPFLTKFLKGAAISTTWSWFSAVASMSCEGATTSTTSASIKFPSSSFSAVAAMSVEAVCSHIIAICLVRLNEIRLLFYENNHLQLPLHSHLLRVTFLG
nr:hypothetical protein [Tanacetum cinerariifolium]